MKPSARDTIEAILTQYKELYRQANDDIKKTNHSPRGAINEYMELFRLETTVKTLEYVLSRV